MTVWDERFAGDEYAYGTEPNGFLVEVAGHIPPGRVLSVGEGEGRNAAYLASLGHRVTAVDSSSVGLAKAEKLAAIRGLTVETVHADLDQWVLQPGAWDGIVSIFCHLPPDLRRRIHRAVVAGLRPGGVYILEGYHPRQLEIGTGGPPTAALMVRVEDVVPELAGLDVRIARETVRDVVEGRLHHGRAAVVQVLAVAPEVAAP